MKFTRSQRINILNKFDQKCAYCGRELVYDILTIDHVIPLSLGGTNLINNLFPACELCNRLKANYKLEDFRVFLESRWKTFRKTQQAKIINQSYRLPGRDFGIRFYFESYMRREKLREDLCSKVS